MALIRLDGSRRSFLRRLGALGAAHTIGAVGLAQSVFAQQAKSKAGTAAKPAAGKPWSNEYWAQKGDAKLYMFRKRRNAPTRNPPDDSPNRFRRRCPVSRMTSSVAISRFETPSAMFEFPLPGDDRP